MDEKTKDDVTLPTDKDVEETPEPAVETEEKDEPTPEVPENFGSPAEDEAKEAEPEATLEDAPKEDKPDSTPLHKHQEKLKLFQSRDREDLERKYAEWTKEMCFLEDDSEAYVAERHIADGGNGLIHLAIFYVD